MELNDGDFRVLHTSESTESVTHFLVENKAFDKLKLPSPVIADDMNDELDDTLKLSLA